jgi:transposase
MGAEARQIGHGGIARVAEATGVSRPTVSRGAAELEAGQDPLGGRARRAGAGRKRAADKDPGLLPALLGLVRPTERGDPESPIRWTTLSTRRLAAELTAQGHKVSPKTVADLLHAEGFSLQGNAKTAEGSQHEDRDAQFAYIASHAKARQAAGQPVVSVGSKKKELVGSFKNGGREWRPKGNPAKVNVHDFPDPALGKANPYGVYDTGDDSGWASVGTDHDTAAFAVASIKSWWDVVGRARYPGASCLLVTADGGGSNGYRVRLWKTELAKFAVESGLEVTVCHLPPGTSKWNAVEHRLFSHIKMNWRGRPLTSHEVVVNTIGATTTRSGLSVRAELDTAEYPLGVKVPDRQMEALAASGVWQRRAWHGEWNYTMNPTPSHDTHTK